MYLSAWELNQKKPHPKHLKNIIDYLGYIPKINSKHERIGTQTKLYRIKHNLTLKEFCQMTNIDFDLVVKWENARYCKISKQETYLFNK
jgi:DNA-binding transcriptional regulator YiaG